MSNNSDEKFLSRWSRLKREPKVAEPDVATHSNQGDLPDGVAPLQRQEKAAANETAAPSLPPVDELTMASDFRGFFHPKVAESVKRAALKKLFTDPHFNIMDGLDIYIDDYSISDPLPPEMLAQMKSAQKIFKWARNELEEDETAPAQLANDGVPAMEAPQPILEGEVDPVVTQLPAEVQVAAADSAKFTDAPEAILPPLDEQK